MSCADSLASVLEIQSGDIVALVGGGGKTSLLFALAEQLAAQGLRALCTTTTKMMVPSVPADCDVCILGESLEAACGQVLTAFEAGPATRVVLAKGFAAPHGKDAGSNRRVDGIPTLWPRALLEAGACDVVLVEADGARRLPFKAPAQHEPVLPDTAHIVVAVAGVDALGRPLAEDFVCRAHVIAALTDEQPGIDIDADMMGTVLGSRTVWKVPSSVRTFAACVNKVDTEENAVQAEIILESALEPEHNVGLDVGLATGERGGKRGMVAGVFTA